LSLPPHRARYRHSVPSTTTTSITAAMNIRRDRNARRSSSWAPAALLALAACALARPTFADSDSSASFSTPNHAVLVAGFGGAGTRAIAKLLVGPDTCCSVEVRHRCIISRNEGRIKALDDGPGQCCSPVVGAVQLKKPGFKVRVDDVAGNMWQTQACGRGRRLHGHGGRAARQMVLATS